MTRDEKFTQFFKVFRKKFILEDANNTISNSDFITLFFNGWNAYENNTWESYCSKNNINFTILDYELELVDAE